MIVLVTGSAGFLGRAVVRKLLYEGHKVVALVRPLTDTSSFESAEKLKFVRGDLRQLGDWCGQIGTVDTVIHLAAATGGDLAEQFALTVAATENLLAVLSGGRLRRFVHVSSFSVYDFAALAVGAKLDESSPLETHPDERDPYSWTKLIQEKLVREHCRETGVSLAILRPGAIYGPGKTWSFGSALRLGGIDLIFSPLACLRLTHVDNCADAILLAAISPAADGQVFNVVDDHLPSHARYRMLCRDAGASVPRAVPVPWILVAASGRMVRLLNRILFGNRARLPEFLAYRRQQARWKPLRYSNARLKAVLGWSPRLSIDEGVRTVIGKRSPRPTCNRKQQDELLVRGDVREGVMSRIGSQLLDGRFTFGLGGAILLAAGGVLLALANALAQL